MIEIWFSYYFFFTYTCIYIQMYIIYIQCTVKPVLRSHLWDKNKWSYKTGDLLRGSIHMKFSMTRQENGDI